MPALATYERQAAALRRDIRLLRQDREMVTAPVRTPIALAAELGIVLDPWQRAVLESDRDELMLASRQAGKGEVASLLALSQLLDDAGSTTVIVAPTERQAKRLLRRVKKLYRSLSHIPPTVIDSALAMELRNGSECLAMPGSEETIRGLEAVDLLVIDEAALVDDPLYEAVDPFLATTSGRTVAMSTAGFKEGWFYEAYTAGGDSWHRSKVTAYDIPRISPAYLERTRQRIGQRAFLMDFMVEFQDIEDAAFAFADVKAVVSADVKPLFSGRVFTT